MTAFAQTDNDQTAGSVYQQQLRDYQDQRQTFQDHQKIYDNAAAVAEAKRTGYHAETSPHAEDLAAYQLERNDYDAHYGRGAWARRYGYSSRRDAARAP